VRIIRDVDNKAKNKFVMDQKAEVWERELEAAAVAEKEYRAKVVGIDTKIIETYYIPKIIKKALNIAWKVFNKTPEEQAWGISQEDLDSSTKKAAYRRIQKSNRNLLAMETQIKNKYAGKLSKW